MVTIMTTKTTAMTMKTKMTLTSTAYAWPQGG